MFQKNTLVHLTRNCPGGMQDQVGRAKRNRRYGRVKVIHVPHSSHKPSTDLQNATSEEAPSGEKVTRQTGMDTSYAMVGL